MDFAVPTEIVAYLGELDAFIDAEIKPLQARDDNERFFDHRREHARTDWDRGGLPRHDWEAVLDEARGLADRAGHLRYSLPVDLGGKGVPGIAMALAAPFCALAFTTAQLLPAGLFFLLMNLCVGTFQGPLFSTLHSFVGPRMRATASAILLLLVTLVGLGLGPLVVGGASDLIAAASFGTGDFQSACRAGTIIDARCQAASAQGLRLALLCCCVVFAWSSLHFFLASRSIRADVTD